MPRKPKKKSEAVLTPYVRNQRVFVKAKPGYEERTELSILVDTTLRLYSVYKTWNAELLKEEPYFRKLRFDVERIRFEADIRFYGHRKYPEKFKDLVRPERIAAVEEQLTFLTRTKEAYPYNPQPDLLYVRVIIVQMLSAAKALRELLHTWIREDYATVPDADKARWVEHLEYHIDSWELDDWGFVVDERRIEFIFNRPRKIDPTSVEHEEESEE